MLNRIAIEAALPLAQRLSERNVRVLPAEGTPLMSLVLAGDTTDYNGSGTEKRGMVELVQARGNQDLHHMAKKDIVSLGVESVSRLHAMTQSTVLPHIKEIFPKVQAIVSKRRVEAVLPYSVKMREIPLIFSNPALKALADKYPVAGNGDWATRILRNADLMEIKDLVKTGMEGVDKELNDSLSVCNDEGYDVIRKVLNGSMHPKDVKDDYLPGLLVTAAGLYNEPGQGINMSLVDYNAAVNGLIQVVSRMTRSAILRYEAMKKNGVLYSPTRESIETIVVMGEVYRDMLDKGLTPEALIGNEMSGRRFSQGQLIENKGALEKAYHREMNLRQLKVQSEMTTITADALRTVLIADMQERNVEEPTEKIKQLNDLIRTLTTSLKIDDVTQLTTICVCKLYYEASDALTFIQLMNHVGATVDDDTDPREVALMASFKYISRWLAKQLGITQA